MNAVVRRTASPLATLALVTAVLAVMAVSIVASAEEVARSWRETLQLDTSLLATKRFENVRALIDQEEWDAAFAALDGLTAEFPETLVSLAQGRYASTSLAARLLTAGLSPEGLKAYRRQIDGWADQQFAEAVASLNDIALRRLLESASVSQAGDDVLDTLAEWAWERGDAAEARRYWRQILPLDDPADDALLLNYPDSNLDPAGICARLILCSLAEGNIERAADELALFAELFPTATGLLGGKETAFVEHLRPLIDADEWTGALARVDESTFARRSRRDAGLRRRVTIGRPRWTQSLDPVYVPRWERPRPALPERGVLSRYPVTWRTGTQSAGVFWQDGTTIRGLRLEDGRPLWPLDRDDADAGDDDDAGTIYPPFPATANWLPPNPAVGVPRYTLSINDDRMYGLLGPSLLTLPRGGQQASPTRLVCLDLPADDVAEDDLAADESQLRWFHTPEELFPPGWMITGTPTVSRNRLFVPLLRTEPQWEVAVACLQADDGRPLWQQTIGRVLRDPGADKVELGHQLVTLADGRLFLSTDFGGIASLDAETGRVEWVVTYPASERVATDRSDESRVGLLPPVSHEGIVYAKPNDGDELLAIDAVSGHVFWRRHEPGLVVHLLGVTDGMLIASGDHLWGIDLATGRTVWRFGYDDAAGFGYGRGVITSGEVIWPTHEELFIVDTVTGRVIRRIPLRESLGVTGGHLTLTTNRLLIAGPDHLTAFEVHPVELDR